MSDTDWASAVGAEVASLLRLVLVDRAECVVTVDRDTIVDDDLSGELSYVRHRPGNPRLTLTFGGARDDIERLVQVLSNHPPVGD